MPQDLSVKNHLEVRIPEEDGDAGSEIGNNSGGGESPGNEEHAALYPQITPAQYQLVFSLTMKAYSTLKRQQK